MQTIELDSDMPPAAALQAIVAACLRGQILPHAAAIARGKDGSARRVHRLRVGLRRLRGALRLFGRWATGVRPGELQRWDQALAGYARPLGRIRDLDVIGDPSRRGERDRLLQAAAAQLRAPDFGLLMLALMTAIGAAAASPAGSVSKLARRRLRQFERRLRREARGFSAPGTDDEVRHRLRKRLKRLRDGIELAAALLKPRRTRRRLKRLCRVQDALGRYNDQRVIDEHLAARHGGGEERDAAAHRRDRLLHEAAAQLGRWRRSP